MTDTTTATGETAAYTPTLPGRDVPKPGQISAADEEQFDNPEPAAASTAPPPPAGMKPNDLIALPPGSVKAPSSYPGAPPVDVEKVE